MKTIKEKNILARHSSITHRIAGIFLCLQCCFGYVFTQDISWEKLNGPYGGSIRVMSVGPYGEILGGTIYNGVYRYRDGKWCSLGLPKTYFVTEIVFSPNGDLYVGTRSGLYRSSDSGETWTLIPIQNASVSALAVSPDGTTYASVAYQGILRSKDNWSSWESVSTEIGASSLAVNSQGIIFAGSGGDIYRSTDRGENWTLVYHFEALFGVSVEQLIVDKFDRIYAATDGSGVIGSMDNGDTWIVLARLTGWVTSVAINSKGHVYAASSLGPYKTTDSGISWQSLTVPWNSFIWTLAVNARDELIVGTEAGPYILHDDGTTWSSVNEGLNNLTIYSIASTQAGKIFAAAKGYGCYSSTDNGMTWIKDEFISSWSITSLARNKNGNLYAGGVGIFRSTDDGITWNKLNHSTNPGSFAFNLLGHIYLGTDPVWRSSDDGITWTQLTSTGSSGNSVSIAIGRENQIYLGKSNGHGGLFKSTNDGQSWSTVGKDDLATFVEAIVIDRNGYIYVGTNSYGVYRSTDDGETWTRLTNGIQSEYFTASALSVDSLDNVYVGSWALGLYKSTNYGDSWSSFDNGIINSIVYSLHSMANGTIYAGTVSGVYQTVDVSITTLPISTLTKTFTLSQNYPNPFNPSTIIEFALPERRFVNLNIYDMLGNEIETLVNEQLNPGTFRVHWDASSRAAGVYLYRLRAGGFVETRKLILLK